MVPSPVVWPLVGAAAARESGVRGRVAKWFAVAATATSTRLALAVLVVALAPAEASGVFADRAELKAAVEHVGAAEATHGWIGAAAQGVEASAATGGAMGARRLSEEPGVFNNRAQLIAAVNKLAEAIR